MILAIIGTARMVSESERKFYDQVWTIGRLGIEADLYICLHGEHSIHPEKDRTWTDADLQEVIQRYPSFPLTNSISIMLALVTYWVESGHVIGNLQGLERVDILASPLISNSEYKEQRPSVAFWVGYLQALGVEVNWEGGFKRGLPYMWGKS